MVLLPIDVCTLNKYMSVGVVCDFYFRGRLLFPLPFYNLTSSRSLPFLSCTELFYHTLSPSLRPTRCIPLKRGDVQRCCGQCQFISLAIPQLAISLANTDLPACISGVNRKHVLRIQFPLVKWNVFYVLWRASGK